MTATEFAQLAAAIKTYYPRDNVLPTDRAMELWFDALKDLEYRNAVAGLKKYVESHKYPPTISDIREYAMAYRPTVLEIEEKHVGVEPPENWRERLRDMWK